MRKRGQRSLGMIFALVTMLVVSACGASGAQNAAAGAQGNSAAPAASAPTPLYVTMGLGDNEWKVMREDVFPAFEKQYNVKIEAVQMNAGDVVKKLTAMKQANKVTVDLIAQDNMQLAPLVQNGLVEDLSAYRSELPSAILPSMLKVGTFDGKLYFLPFRPNVEITYYNQKMLDKYGLQPPKTWDELLNVAKTLKEREGIGRVSIKANLADDSATQLFDWIRSAGGDPLVLNDAGSVTAYTFLQKLWPYLSPDSAKADWNVTNTFLATDDVYLAQNWPFGVDVIVNKGGKKEIKAYQGWAGPVRESHVLGGDVLGIPAGAPHKDLAIKLARYLLSKQVQETLVSKLAWPSARSDAYGTVADWQKPYFAAVNAALAHAEARPNVTYWADLAKDLNGAFREIVMEGKPVKATLDKYHNLLAQTQAAAQGK